MGPHIWISLCMLVLCQFCTPGKELRSASIVIATVGITFTMRIPTRLHFLALFFFYLRLILSLLGSILFFTVAVTLNLI